MEQPITTEFTLTSENHSRFTAIKNQRAVRKAQIRHLKKAMKEGSYIEASPFYVNKSGSRYFIIDGNHRIIAFREIVKSNKNFELKISLVVFRGLSEVSERDVYDSVAKQIPQSINDLLNLHKDEFELWNMLGKKPFPVRTTIYPTKMGMSLRIYLNMLGCSNIEDKKMAMGGLNRDDFLEVGKKTTEEDFYDLNEFFKVFVSTFGYVNLNNRYCKQNFLIPLFYIWKRNLSHPARLNEKIDSNKNLKRKYYWIKRFERLIGDTRIIELCNFQSSREARETGVDLILEILNDNPMSKAYHKGSPNLPYEFQDLK